MKRVPLLVLVGATSCMRSAPVVGELDVDEFRGGDVVAMTREDLLQALETTLKNEGVQRGDPETPKSLEMKLAVQVEDPAMSGAKGTLVEAILAVRERGRDLGFELRAAERTSAKDAEALETNLRELLDKSLTRLVREAKMVVVLREKPTDDVRRALFAKDPATREAALSILVRRKDREAMPRLLERLTSTEVSELRATIGSLVELGAPEAVNPIIQATQHRGYVVEREAIYAVAALGGDDAVAYLDMVASGSPDPGLSRAAQDALAELLKSSEKRKQQ